MQQISELLPAVIPASQVPAKQESRPQRTGDERKFEVALTEPKIIQSEQEKLMEVLRYVMVLIGLRGQNFPDEIETQILIGFITENYGGHTPAEIKLAFEMAITRKLNVDAKCYENFSVAYFVSIMEAYREWAKEQIKQLPAPVKVRELSQMEKVDINMIWALKLLNEINKLPTKVKL
jgi:hypothetical protein